MNLAYSRPVLIKLVIEHKIETQPYQVFIPFDGFLRENLEEVRLYHRQILWTL